MIAATIPFVFEKGAFSAHGIILHPVFAVPKKKKKEKRRNEKEKRREEDTGKKEVQLRSIAYPPPVPYY